MSERDHIFRADAHVVGMVRGREIDARAVLELEEQSLTLRWTRAAPWRLALDGIDGVMHAGSQLTCYLSSGDVLELTGGEDVQVLGAHLVARACTMPELTRGLRALGSLRGAPGAAHDAWFAPLLSARRAMEGVTDPERQIAFMDATRLAKSMANVIAELAAVRAPTDVPRQRAIEAVLEEDAEPVFRALQRMENAAQSLRLSPPDSRLSAWRAWVQSVREVFAEADESWSKATGVLTGS